jgi:hypothetical protein
MATFYVGPRPVLRGQNTNDMVNPYYTMTGKAKGKGTYSYYPLRSTSQLLTGAPDNAYTPGSGARPGNRLMSQLFTGSTLYAGTTPLAGTFPNGSANYDGARFRPLEYKGIAGAQALNGGHAQRNLYYGFYSNFIFDGVASAEVMPAGYGHAARTDAQGAPNSFGLFRPDEFHGVASAVVFTADYGQPNTTTIYGRSNPKRWTGVPSAQAL